MSHADGVAASGRGSLTREAELALLIAEQEADDRGDLAGGWSRFTSFDAPLTEEGLTLADVIGEEDIEIAALTADDSTHVRLVTDKRVRESDVASWRWARFRRGWSYAQIAAHFGVNYAVVYYHVRKTWRLPSERRDRLEAKLPVFREAYERGATLLEIATEFYEESGYASPESCYQQVRLLFHYHGVPLRPGGTWKHGLRSRTATEAQRREWAARSLAAANARRRARLVRCPEKTKRGRLCRRWVIAGEDRCVVHARHVPARWTREVVIERLRAWRDAHGRFPRTYEWTKAAEDHPTFKTVYDLFGSWGNALAEAQDDEPSLARAA